MVSSNRGDKDSRVIKETTLINGGKHVSTMEWFIKNKMEIYVTSRPVKSDKGDGGREFSRRFTKKKKKDKFDNVGK